MIKIMQSKGQRVVVMYMKADFVPCDPDDAEVVKLSYPDGRNVYLHPEAKDGDHEEPVR